MRGWVAHLPPPPPHLLVVVVGVDNDDRVDGLEVEARRAGARAQVDVAVGLLLLQVRQGAVKVLVARVGVEPGVGGGL